MITEQDMQQRVDDHIETLNQEQEQSGHTAIFSQPVVQLKDSSVPVVSFEESVTMLKKHIEEFWEKHPHLLERHSEETSQKEASKTDGPVVLTIFATKRA